MQQHVRERAMKLPRYRGVAKKIGACAALLLSFSAPHALAQYVPPHMVPSQNHSTKATHSPQTRVKTSPVTDVETSATGINTGGTVRVNTLACLEALLNMVVNGTALIGLIGGAAILLGALKLMKAGSANANRKLMISGGVITAALLLAPLTNFAIRFLVDKLY